MPKARRIVKRDGRIVKLKSNTKLRIGTRKSNKSALLMSTEDLKKVLDNPDKRKYHSKAKQVLAKRGVV